MSISRSDAWNFNKSLGPWWCQFLMKSMCHLHITQSMCYVYIINSLNVHCAYHKLNVYIETTRQHVYITNMYHDDTQKQHVGTCSRPRTCACQYHQLHVFSTYHELNASRTRYFTDTRRRRVATCWRPQVHVTKFMCRLNTANLMRHELKIAQNTRWWCFGTRFDRTC